MTVHEKHAVATWNCGSHPDLCLKTQENVCLDGRMHTDFQQPVRKQKMEILLTFPGRVLLLCG